MLLNWKGPELSPSPQNCSKDSWKLLSLFISKFGNLMSCGLKDIFKNVSCTNIHHDITDLVNHGMVKNTKNLNILRMEHNFSAE